MEKILLIDGSNLIFRAYHATKNIEMKSPQNIDVTAINTTTLMLKKLIENFKPSHILIALDTGKPTKRHLMYEGYKKTREKTPENLKQQFPIVKDLYHAFGIKFLEKEGYEADDIIASYAKYAKENNLEVQIVSSDKDLLQLIDEKIKVFVPKTGPFSKDINYDEKIFHEKYGFKPKDIILYKALVGDKSDNINGIEKIGQKTAQTLISDYQNLEGIKTGLKEEKIKGKIGENLASGLEKIKENIELITLYDNINLEYQLDDIKFNEIQKDNVHNFLNNYGLFKSANLFKKNNEFINKVNYEEINEFNSKYIGKKNYIFTKTIDYNYHFSKKLGFGLYNEHGLFYLKYENINQDFINFISDENEKITYDLKQLMVILNLKEVGNFTKDLKIMNNLLHFENNNKELNFICLEHNIDYTYNFLEIYENKTNPKYNEEKVKLDITSSAKALSELVIHIENKLNDLKLLDVYYKIEHPLIEVLATMEIEGILIDKEKLESLKNEYQKEISNIEEKIKNITDINIASPKQLSDFLFINLQIDPKNIKKTQNGYSTDQESLEIIKANTTDKKVLTFINLVLDYRKNVKIYKTYLLGIEKFIVNNKIHPIYQQLATDTGRLTATVPNIQNIPVKTKEGKVLRSLFIAEKNTKFVSCDYSQVELRILAKIANEKTMLNYFYHNQDIHAQTAKTIFGEVNELTRKNAKNINFGIIYGISAYGLAKIINSSNQDAKNFIDKYYETFPEIKNYQDKIINDALKNNFIKTKFERIRYLDQNKTLEQQKRIIINTPIQGTAADVIKIAMINIHNYLKKENCGTMIMQIHDELIFYLNENNYEINLKEIIKLMENVELFNDILKVDYACGDNWEEV